MASILSRPQCVKELDVIVHKKIFTLYNTIKFWLFCTPTQQRTWWLRWELGIVTRSYHDRIWGRVWQNQVSRAGTSNYIPQILWDVITCPCPWYLLLTQKSIYIIRITFINPLGPSDAIWRRRSWSTRVQVLACCLPAPSQYLNQCWLMISEWMLWHSPGGNFTENT